MTKPIDHQPYPTDLDYLSEELEYIQCRAQRVASERDASGDGSGDPPGIEGIRDMEMQLRETIDHRLQKNRDEGQEIGLDQLCRDHALDELERLILILAVFPVLGSEMAEHQLASVTPRYTPATVSPETLWELLSMGTEARLLSLTSFLPNSRLVTSGLVCLGYKTDTPASVAGIGLELTWRALATLTGLEDLARAGEPLGERDGG